MNKLLPICEYIQDPKWKIIKESSIGGKKTLEVEGRFQYADKRNQNDRMYPLKLLEREVGKLQFSIGKRRLVGELDHPAELETKLSNASHLITKLWMEGKECIGRLEVLPTSKGNDLRGLYESRVDVGVSSRGAGRAIERGEYYEIAPDFQLKTFDVVSDPSTHEAYPQILSESQIIRPRKTKIFPVTDYSNYRDLVLAGLS